MSDTATNLDHLDAQQLREMVQSLMGRVKAGELEIERRDREIAFKQATGRAQAVELLSCFFLVFVLSVPIATIFVAIAAVVPAREIHTVEDDAVDLLACMRKPLDALVKFTQLCQIVAGHQQHGTCMSSHCRGVGGHQHRRAIDYDKVIVF